MALPLQLSSIYYGNNWRASSICGPFKSSSGNYYLFANLSVTSSKVTAQKATDPTSSFSAIGTDQDIVAGSVALGITATQEGDTIHIVGLASQSNYYYSSFNMSTDAWSGTWTKISNNTSVTNAGGRYAYALIVVRSNGDLVVLYEQQDNVMGTIYNRVDYARRISGTWTTDVNVSTSSLANKAEILGAALGTSDKVHFLYIEYSNGTRQKTLNSSNVLQTAVNVTPTDIFGCGVSYVSGSNTKVCFVASDGAIPTTDSSIYFDSADSPTINTSTLISSAYANNFPTASVDNNQIIAGYVLASDGKYYIKISTDGGATWGSAIQVDAATLNNTRITLGRTGPIYLRGSNYVYGFTYYDGTNYYYNEYNVRAVPTTTPTGNMMLMFH